MLAVLVLLTVCVPHNGISDTRTDSLLTRLRENPPPPERLSALLLLASEALQTETDTALKAAREAIELARRLKQDLELSQALELAARALWNQRRHQEALRHFQEEKLLIRRLSPDNIDLSPFWTRRRTANLNHLIGLYHDMDMHENAARHCEELLELEAVLKDHEVLHALSMAGYFYYLSADYTRALKTKLRSVRLAESLKDTAYLISETSHLGFIHRDMANLESAMELFRKAAGLARTTGDIGMTISSLNEIGNVHFYNHDYDQALSIKTEALNLARSLNSPSHIAFVSHDIGLIYQQQGQHERALEHFQSACETDRKSGNTRGVTISLINIGQAYYYLGHHAPALKAYHEALGLAESADLHSLRQTLYDAIARTYAALNDYSLAFSYLNRSIALKDSLFNQEIARITTDLQTQYETEQKEQQIRLLTHENELKQLSLSRQRIFMMLISTALVFLSVLTLIVIRQYRVNRRTHKTIQEQNVRLRETLENIKTLKALLPICSSCKKIRDDEGYWEQVEIYIQKQVGTAFSHGICPDCAKQYEAELTAFESEKGVEE